MFTKRCVKCAKRKSVKAFPKGYKGRPHSYCKSCHVERAKTYRRANAEKIREYQRRAQKARQQKERAARLRRLREAMAKDWRVLFLHKLAGFDRIDRTQCYSITAKLVRLGLLPPMLSCDDCGVFGQLERHHPDYQNPANVRVLCRTCHKKEDGKAVE